MCTVPVAWSPFWVSWRRRVWCTVTPVTVLAAPWPSCCNEYDVSRQPSQEVVDFYRAGPAGIRTTKAFSQDCRWPELDVDRAEGCIRSLEHAYSLEGGLAVLSGTFALDRAIVKTAGVDDENLCFRGPALVFESQDTAVAGIPVAQSRPVKW
ncbi:dihydroxy-acid dehydratase [Escherichia coli]